MNCPNCNNSNYSKKFTSYSQVDYKNCNYCGCVYQDPIIKLNYSDDYWQGAIDPDGVKRNFLNERDFKIKNWYGNAINFVNKLKDVSILDIGCGLGYFLSALNGSIKKFGLEDSSFACDYVRENFKNIEIKNGDFKEIKSYKQKFDVVMFYHVIEHLEKPAEAIELIKKVLKEDGFLIIGTPNVSSLVSKIFKKNFRHYIPAHICLYSEQSLRVLLEKNNFEIIEIEKPFFKTKYNNISNYLNMFKVNNISPAFYGSIITFYCRNRK